MKICLSERTINLIAVNKQNSVNKQSDNLQKLKTSPNVSMAQHVTVMKTYDSHARKYVSPSDITSYGTQESLD